MRRYLSNQVCVDCTKKRAKRYGASNPPKRQASQRKSTLKRYYGLTPEDVAQILARQGGVCAICRSSDPRHKHGWHVDHDHVTGVVRGILCPGCNSGLGQFRDSIESLHAAIEYLSRSANGEKQ